MSASDPALNALIAREIGTPALVVDMAVVEANIARLQALCDEKGINNRPHMKTHKNLRLARLQVAAGAIGLTCQKLGEAEIMAAGGIKNLFISYNLLGDEKMQRLARLLREGVTLSVAADNRTVVEHLATAGRMAGRDLPVLIEIDTGRKRAGVETVGETLALARQIAQTPGLAFEGLMVYPPEDAIPATNRFVAQAKAGLAADGLTVNTLTSGGTPNLATLGQLDGQTEHRSGTSIFNDRMMMAAGVATLDTCALTVCTTVVSRAGETRGILDAGSKVFTTETGWGLTGHGLILEHPEAQVARFAEEHGFLDLTACNKRPAVGDVVRVVPNHVCPVVNVVGRLVFVRDGAIEAVEPVEARGALS